MDDRQSVIEQVKKKMWYAKWAVRIILFIVIFFIVVLSSKWVIALQNREQNTIRQVESNQTRIEQLESKPTPSPVVKKKYITRKPRSLWDKIWNP